jgi:hypothetical protein
MGQATVRACLLAIPAHRGNTVSVETPGVQALAAESMMRRLGVTHAEAIRRLEFQDATSEVSDKIHDLLGDRDGDMWFDHDDGGRLKVGVVRRDGGMESSAVDEVRHLLGAHGLSDGSDLVPVDHSTQELDDAHSPMTAQLSDLYGAGKIASGRNPSLNALVIHMATTVTGADRARLQRVADQAPVRVVLRQTQCPTMFAVEE